MVIFNENVVNFKLILFAIDETKSYPANIGSMNR